MFSNARFSRSDDQTDVPSGRSTSFGYWTDSVMNWISANIIYKWSDGRVNSLSTCVMRIKMNEGNYTLQLFFYVHIWHKVFWAWGKRYHQYVIGPINGHSFDRLWVDRHAKCWQISQSNLMLSEDQIFGGPCFPMKSPINLVGWKRSRIYCTRKTSTGIEFKNSVNCWNFIYVWMVFSVHKNIKIF